MAHPVVRLKPISSGFSFSVYPNPTTETLNIEKQQNKQNFKIDFFDIHKKNSLDFYELYNFDSNLITNGQLNKRTSIDVSKYKNGRYILKITSNGKSETHHIQIE